jgi:hypothetical protein
MKAMARVRLLRVRFWQFLCQKLELFALQCESLCDSACGESRSFRVHCAVRATCIELEAARADAPWNYLNGRADCVAVRG